MQKLFFTFLRLFFLGCFHWSDVSVPTSGPPVVFRTMRPAVAWTSKALILPWTFPKNGGFFYPPNPSHLFIGVLPWNFHQPFLGFFPLFLEKIISCVISTTINYPPGDGSHIPPKGKLGKSSTQNAMFGGYVSSLEGMLYQVMNVLCCGFFVFITCVMCWYTHAVLWFFYTTTLFF